MRWPRVRHAPLLVLGALAVASPWLPFLLRAPNRLLSGVPVWLDGRAAWQLSVPVLALLAGAFSVRPRPRLTYALAVLGMCLLARDAGRLSLQHGAGQALAERFSLGPGFWTGMFAFGLAAVVAVQQSRAGRWLVLAAATLPAALFWLMARRGDFASLSLAQEAASHAASFGAAWSRHLLLVGLTLAGALALGLPLGLAAQRRRTLRKPVFAALNIVQTVPSVALFGLLIAPLSAAGLSGIGLVPALLALVLYALLPIVRAVVAGLDGVDASVREAALAMGFSRRALLWRVELPLAAFALLAGLRIVTVQTIGLCVVAALIGAGGLGDFVFQGLGQYATDLVLLGALPAIALALAADLLLRLAASGAATAR